MAVIMPAQFKPIYGAFVLQNVINFGIVATKREKSPMWICAHRLSFTVTTRACMRTYIHVKLLRLHHSNVVNLASL